VVVLQHPRERKVPVGTGRLAALGLPSAELLVGIDFDSHPRLLEALADPARPAALLFPGPGSRVLTPQDGAAFGTLIAVDGTWDQARQIVQRTAALAALPRLRLAPAVASEYRIRRAPRRDYLSTVEALALALGLLEGQPERFDALLAPFRALVDAQLARAERREGPSRHRARWASAPEKVPRVPAALTGGPASLLCAAAEANAWSSRIRGGYPDELVHWLAVRLATGERFEAVLAPRHPLAPSTPLHTRLSPEVLAAGEARGAFVERWRAFLRQGDALCVWGRWPVDLAREAGAPLPDAIVDARKVAGDLLMTPPGPLVRYLERNGLPWAAAGRGRGGERLGQLAAAVAHMASLSRRP
jgi:DTW domain-containing protein YfiP